MASWQSQRPCPATREAALLPSPCMNQKALLESSAFLMANQRQLSTTLARVGKISGFQGLPTV